VEIDPEVVALGNRHFGLRNHTNLDSIVISDARSFLRESHGKFDLIEIDLYHSAQIPFYLATREFFLQVRDRLTERGRTLINVYDPTSNRLVLRAIENTIAAAFRDVVRVHAGGNSFFLSAGMAPVPRREPSSTSTVSNLERYFLANSEAVTFSSGARLLVDDHAPIEVLYGH
jgi:spermidine synthase